ncbi:hypothetical protein B0H14DRAFT_3879482 [Mycena olivaceomarginata]|nr:hypothetical protein B0H14DRAFT_3879482 [Mycena olivaceomarginata]
MLVDAGTGYGKTLCQIVLNIMRRNTTAITISPRKTLHGGAGSGWKREWGAGGYQDSAHAMMTRRHAA